MKNLRENARDKIIIIGDYFVKNKIFLLIFTSVISSLLSASVVAHFINVESQKAIVCGLITASLISIFVAVFTVVISVVSRFSIDKLKINDTIIISAAHYILLSKDRNDFNNLKLDNVNIKYILDRPASIPDLFKESIIWSFHGTAKKSISKLSLHLTSPLCERFKNYIYMFDMNGHSKYVKPKLLESSIYGQLTMDSLNISENDEFDFKITQNHESNKRDMHGFLYLIDPQNYADDVKSMNISIIGYDKLYKDSIVQVYAFNRIDVSHKKLKPKYCFEDYSTNLGYYECMINLVSDNFEKNKLYGFIINNKYNTHN